MQPEPEPGPRRDPIPHHKAHRFAAAAHDEIHPPTSSKLKFKLVLFAWSSYAID